MRRLTVVVSGLLLVVAASVPLAGSAQATIGPTQCTVDAGKFVSATSHHSSSVDASWPGMACVWYRQQGITATLETWNGKAWVLAAKPFWSRSTPPYAGQTTPYVWPSRIYVSAPCKHGAHVRVLVTYEVTSYAYTASYLTNYSVCS